MCAQHHVSNQVEGVTAPTPSIFGVHVPYKARIPHLTAAAHCADKSVVCRSRVVVSDCDKLLSAMATAFGFFSEPGYILQGAPKASQHAHGQIDTKSFRPPSVTRHGKASPLGKRCQRRAPGSGMQAQIPLIPHRATMPPSPDSSATRWAMSLRVAAQQPGMQASCALHHGLF